MKKLTKIFGVVTVLALTLAVAAPASALTADQQALLDLLVSLGIIDASQVATVTAASTTTTTTTGSSSYCGPFTRDLTVGSTGADVMTLQKALNERGFSVAATGAGSTGNESSYFGSLTRSAVAAYQSAKGIAPAVGYFGPLTRASFAGQCSTTGTGSTTTTTTTTTTLEGGAGDISLSAKSTYSGEEVGEGEEEVPVMAFEVEADDNSDVQLDSIKIELFQDTTADSQKLEDYASEVSVWFDGEMVGSADAEDFSEESDYYSKSISLDDVVVEAGEEVIVTIAVSALSNLDSGDIDTDDWSADLLSVRFTDGDGVTTTETGSAAQTDGAGAYEKNFDFATFAVSSDAELEVSLEDDAINEAHVLDVDDASDTSHSILSFTLEASGDSDIWVDEIPVVITTTGETNESVIVISADLMLDGESLDSQDVPAGGVATFSDLDLTIEAGDSVEFIVEVELQDTDGALDDADTVQATVTVASIDAEDESGDSITATGAAAGDAHTVYDKGIMVEFVGSSYVKTSSDTTGINETVEFTLEFDVTAFGDDMWIEDTCVDAATGTDVDAIEVYLEGDANFDNTSCTDVDATGDFGTNWEVQEGDTETFSVTILGNGGEAGVAGNPTTFKARLSGIGYNVGTDAVGDTVYNFNLTDYKSSAVTVYDR